MTQNEKDLLLKDISARLPYGVKISVNNNIEKVDAVDVLDNVVGYGSWLCSDVEEVKPYLFPMSSMTEEQKEEHKDLLDNQYSFDANGNIFTLQDFYCKHHIDYRGLIPIDLAIDSTGLNIY